MREGVPLPGVTPPAVVSQLAHRVFGPMRRDRVAAVLDFHGLAGRPAQTPSEVAARHGVAPATLRVWIGRVAAAGARLPLSAGVVADSLRCSRPDQDHLGRTRIAATLGLAAPAPPSAPPVPGRSVGQGPVTAETTRAAIDVLLTAGPLDPEDLFAAVNRQRRVRHRELIARGISWPPRGGPGPRSMEPAVGLPHRGDNPRSGTGRSLPPQRIGT